MRRTIFLGFDPREGGAFAVARSSLLRHMTRRIPVQWLILSELQQRGLYRRPIEYRDAAVGGSYVMWDTISDAPISTEHACSRFLVPEVAKSGWALFTDCDVLFRADVNELFDQLDPSKALYCVKHKFDDQRGLKMNGQFQSPYQRKNWSSVMVFQCDHPANKALTVDMVNELPGRDLHRFCWLEDRDIGELGPEWNFLVGHTDQSVEPKIVHFTSGTPDMPGYEDCEFADEWRAEMRRPLAA